LALFISEICEDIRHYNVWLDAFKKNSSNRYDAISWNGSIFFILLLIHFVSATHGGVGMQPLIIGIVLMVISFGLVLMAIIHGQRRLKFEQGIRRVLLGKKDDDSPPEELQSQAYHIMMELGEALEKDEFAQQKGVKKALSKVTELHAETSEYESDEYEEYDDDKAQQANKKANLKVVK
jgi:hypothetical protein